MSLVYSGAFYVIIGLVFRFFSLNECVCKYVRLLGSLIVSFGGLSYRRSLLFFQCRANRFVLGYSSSLFYFVTRFVSEYCFPITLNGKGYLIYDFYSSDSLRDEGDGGFATRFLFRFVGVCYVAIFLGSVRRISYRSSQGPGFRGLYYGVRIAFGVNAVGSVSSHVQFFLGGMVSYGCLFGYV